MNTENIEQMKMPTEHVQKDIHTHVEKQSQYKRVVSTEDTEVNAQPVDFRRVQHGHGPCSCCGPYSE